MGLFDVGLLWLILWVVKNGAVDITSAVKGRPVPSHQRWMAKHSGAVQTADWGVKTWAANLVADGLAAQTERRRAKAVERKQAPETPPAVDPVDAAVADAIDLTAPPQGLRPETVPADTDEEYAALDEALGRTDWTDRFAEHTEPVPTRRRDGLPETDADRRFFDLRESGYTGWIDQDGYAVDGTSFVQTPEGSGDEPTVDAMRWTPDATPDAGRCWCGDEATDGPYCATHDYRTPPEDRALYDGQPYNDLTGVPSDLQMRTPTCSKCGAAMALQPGTQHFDADGTGSVSTRCSGCGHVHSGETWEWTDKPPAEDPDDPDHWDENDDEDHPTPAATNVIPFRTTTPKENTTMSDTVTGEIVGLDQSIAYAESLAKFAGEHAAAGNEGYIGHLAAAEVSGATLQSGHEMQAKFAEAAAAAEQHATDLKNSKTVQEAYDQAPDAGNKEFLTAGR